MISRKSSIQRALGSMVAGVLLVAGAPLLFTPDASAQIVSFQMGSRSPDRDGQLDETDIKSLVKTLRLDADQEALVQALYEGHRSAWDEATTAHQEAVKALIEGEQNAGRPRDIARKMLSVQKQWRTTQDQLENNFLESVRGIVSTDQLANWPRFERDRRRHSLQAKQAALGGEGVDLIDVAESIDLADEALSRLEPVSNVYAEELDLAIADRTRAIEAVEKQTTPPEGEDPGAIDLEAVKKAQEKLHEKHTAVREVNQRYAALFSGQLSPEDAERFMDLYMERSFPGVYRPTAADRYIRQVRALETLNEEQVRALDVIDADYQRLVSMINDQLVQIIRQDEEKVEEPGMIFSGGDGDSVGYAVRSGVQDRGGSGVAVGLVISSAQVEIANTPVNGQTHQVQSAQPMLIGPGNEAQDDSPQGKLKKSKTELVDRTIDAVAALLSPDQLALAPRPDELQRLEPEEQMRRMLEQALQNAVFTTGDGDQGITITIGGDK